MLKRILKSIQKIIFSTFTLVGYNLLVVPLGLILPINFITIFAIAILGFPALFAFIFIKILIF
ncbi:MAG: pro-sigmaK processing inhibitor BofA family protein [Bacilli bacterium]